MMNYNHKKRTAIFTQKKFITQHPTELTNAVNNFINNENIYVNDIQYKNCVYSSRGCDYLIHSIFVYYTSNLDNELIEKLKRETIKTIYYKEV